MQRWVILFSAALVACAEPARSLDEPLPSAAASPSPPREAFTASTANATASSAASAEPPNHRSRAPHETAIVALLEQDPEYAHDEGRVLVLLPRRRPAREPAYMALSLPAYRGNRAGQWALFCVNGGQARSLGTVGALMGDGLVRLFRTQQGTVVFRRFWFQQADPTPEDAYRGSYEDLELSPEGARTSRRNTPIDTRTAHGRALWGAPRGDWFACDLASFRSTGTCTLEKVGD